MSEYSRSSKADMILRERRAHCREGMKGEWALTSMGMPPSAYGFSQLHKAKELARNRHLQVNAVVILHPQAHFLLSLCTAPPGSDAFICATGDHASTLYVLRGYLH
jgi:hypothetical protein